MVKWVCKSIIIYDWSKSSSTRKKMVNMYILVHLTKVKVKVIHLIKILLSCITFCKQMKVGRRRFFFASFSFWIKYRIALAIFGFIT